MDLRTTIRPVIDHIGSLEYKKGAEKFQNATIRPIIKMQHDLIMSFFNNYLVNKKISIIDMNKDQKMALINKVFKNDHSLMAELRGLIIGHFTVHEFETYTTMHHESNRRIKVMIKERLLSILASDL